MKYFRSSRQKCRNSFPQRVVTLDYGHKSKELAEKYEGLSVQKKCRTTLKMRMALK